MLPQAFQPGEIRDSNDNIIRPGAYGKNTPLVTADAQGILDYIINNFDVIKSLVEQSSASAHEDIRQSLTEHNTSASAHEDIRNELSGKLGVNDTAFAARSASMDANGNSIAETYLPKSGGDLTGALNITTNEFNALSINSTKISDLSQVPAAEETQDIIQHKDATGRRSFFMRCSNPLDSDNFKIQFASSNVGNSPLVFFTSLVNRQSEAISIQFHTQVGTTVQTFEFTSAGRLKFPNGGEIWLE